MNGTAFRTGFILIFVLMIGNDKSIFFALMYFYSNAFLAILRSKKHPVRIDIFGSNLNESETLVILEVVI